jgi:hypothetical protein
MGKRAKHINLTKFASGTARLSPEFCGMIAAACALKLKQNAHPQPAILAIEGSYTETVTIGWDEPDARTEGSFGEKATEFAGECLGIAVTEKLTEFNVVERSFIGTGFDFWLGRKRDLLFQRKARLEISGMDDGDPTEIQARVKRKQNQVDKGTVNNSLRALIVVSQFTRPVAKVIRHA